MNQMWKTNPTWQLHPISSHPHLLLHIPLGGSAWFQLLIVASMILILYELFTIMVFVLSRVGATNVPCGTMIRFIVPLNNSMLYKRNKTAKSKGRSHSLLVSQLCLPWGFHRTRFSPAQWHQKTSSLNPPCLLKWFLWRWANFSLIFLFFFFF